MAQTKRRRRTKHRGNAAGAIEARGRTGRKPTAAERKGASGGRGGATKSARERRLERYDKPPTWKAATQRAALAGVFMFIVAILLLGSVARAVVLLPFVLVIYIPVGYYTDRFLYNKRQRDKARGKA